MRGIAQYEKSVFSNRIPFASRRKEEPAMRVIDTTDEMMSAFASGGFRLADWESYLEAAVPGAKEMCLDDLRECLDAGYSWDRDYLPVLNAVMQDPVKRAEAIATFHKLADDLDADIIGRFGRTVDADLILYLGLCSGAGWVTTVRGRTTILFGIEKIMELNWQGTETMTGLICHELGHVYQAQYGVLNRACETLPDQFLWQLFTEGIAMVFEQELVGDPEAYHQYGIAWKQWCCGHLELLKRSFFDDLSTMTHADQRYFGDWVSFEGYGDTGYYLGARFVRFLLQFDRFDSLIRYDLKTVRAGYERFLTIYQG